MQSSCFHFMQYDSRCIRRWCGWDESEWQKCLPMMTTGIGNARRHVHRPKQSSATVLDTTPIEPPALCGKPIITPDIIVRARKQIYKLQWHPIKHLHQVSSSSASSAPIQSPIPHYSRAMLLPISHALLTMPHPIDTIIALSPPTSVYPHLRQTPQRAPTAVPHPPKTPSPTLKLWMYSPRRLLPPPQSTPV